MGTTAQKLQAIANSKAAIKSAIEAKGVSDVGDVLSTYATKIADIPTGGGSKYGLSMDSILGDVNAQGALQPPATGALSSSAIVSIPDYGLEYKFYKGKISSVSLPNLTTIGQYGMQYAFYQDGVLTSIDLPKITSIGQYGMQYAFYQDTALTSVDLSSLTTIGNAGMYMTFFGCTALDGDIDLSKITTITNPNVLAQTFRGCTSIDNVDLSGLTSITGANGMQYAFYGCTSLKNVYLNKLSTASGVSCLDYAFYGCSSLETVNFSEATSVPALSSTNAFQNTNNYYRIVVPNALYNQWIAATNWSNPSIVTHIEKAINGLVFSAESANSTISLDAVGTPPSLDLVYSTDGGTTFSTYTVGTTVTLANVGDTVMFKAGDNGNTSLATDASNYHKFTMTGSISIEDDISWLLNKNAVPATTALADYAFYGLFNGCASLQNAPELPWTTMGEGCYGHMFEGCTALTDAPDLPSTSLDDYCYEGMFKGCTSITEAPTLPATALATGCYNEMFYGCSSLDTISLSYTGNFSTTYFNDWVYGVSATGTLMYDGTDTTTGTSAIPVGWTVVEIQRPELCFTAREANSTVKMMKSGSAPTVNLEYSTDKSNWNSFVVGTTTVTLANIGDKMWLRAVSTNSSMSGSYNTNYNYFVMTGQIEASGNINSLLNKEPDLVTTCPQYAYPHLFDGCSALVDAQNLKLASTTASQNCYGHKMFYNCSNLVHGPEIMATNLLTVSYTAEFMFQGCSSLQSVKIHATGNSWTSNATVSWMDGVPATGTFYYNGTYTGRGASYIPNGWTITPFAT